MKKKVMILAVLGLVLVASYAFRRQRECESRGDAFQSRLGEVRDRIQRGLPPGKALVDVIGVFSDVGVKPAVYEKMVRGTVQMRGCGQLGCGDSARIEVTVNLDESQHVSSTEVAGFYDNCL